jgi:hypothetical protein
MEGNARGEQSERSSSVRRRINQAESWRKETTSSRSLTKKAGSLREMTTSLRTPARKAESQREETNKGNLTKKAKRWREKATLEEPDEEGGELEGLGEEAESSTNWTMEVKSWMSWRKKAEG